MRCLIFSDLHTYKPYKIQSILEEITKVQIDIIFVLGDISEGYFYDIRDYFKDIPILIVLGNHDNREYLNRWSYLNNIHNEFYNFKEINILGIEGGLFIEGDNNRYISHTQEDIINIFNNLKEKANIIITHNSPYNINCTTNNDIHDGFKGLLNYLNNNKDIIVFHGHQHKNIITKYNENIVCGIYGVVLVDLLKNKIINYNILME